jgi:hypothetical protein
MLDVHAPEHGIHGVRDFFIHLLTITVGLLIALGLEASVEAVHHRHQRIEAQENLRQELSDNANDLKKIQEAMASERTSFEQALVVAQARAEGKQTTAGNILFHNAHATLSEASWGTASVTGVLNYMEYAEVQRFAEAYQMQRQFLTVQESMLQAYLQLLSHVTVNVGSFDVEAMTPVEAAAAVVDLKHALIQIAAMQDIAQVAEQDYGAAIGKR